jgi:magnesium chelatase family protein
MGELQLDGTVRAVRGVLSAVAAAFDRGITHAVVPRENLEEARVLGRGRTRGVARLSEAVGAIVAPDAGSTDGIATGGGEAGPPADGLPAFEELQGQPRFKRVLEVAAAGRHNLIVVGPPGSGKTMGVRALPSILPDLDKEAALEVTRIYSRAGLLGSAGRIVRRPPFRAPHHTASLQGVVGGGRDLLPGEISLAHRGVLFLDEAAEFRKHVLQSLREPTEERRIFIARAGRTYWYPANYELAMAANPCPCGYFGHPSRLCSCSMAEITRYWKRLGGPLMDRIDLRVRVGPEVAPPEEPPVAPPDETSVGPSPTPETEARHRVRRAVERQLQRYATEPYCSNAEVPSSRIRGHLRLEPEQEELVLRAADRLSLSSRAVVSILRTALTIADLEGAAGPSRHHVLEAIQHRRMGEGGQWI